MVTVTVTVTVTFFRFTKLAASKAEADLPDY